MVRRYEVMDEQWKIIEPHLENKAKRTERPQADNRKLFNGVLWILRTGAPWRDLPEYYGPWQTVYKRFAQWQENGKLKELFDQLREGADTQDLCIDGTYIKAHRASAGAKKGTWTATKNQSIAAIRSSTVKAAYLLLLLLTSSRATLSTTTILRCLLASGIRT